MNKTHRKTFNDIFFQPIPATREWRRIEALFIAVYAQVVEGNGSRVRFVLNGIVTHFTGRIRKKRQSRTRFATPELFWRTQE